MKKSFLAIAIIAALFPLAFSTEANAAKNTEEKIKETIIIGPATGGGGTGAMYLNGIKFQGIKFQGIKFQGIKFQSTSMQATKRQGMELQNLKVEGGQLVAVTPVAAE
jgi:uncharacterized protein YjbI with pentapeptide repeats